MPRRLKRFRILAMVIGLVAAILVGLYFYKSFQDHARLPGVPKTWDDERLADLTYLWPV